jgi:hypothetical protein
MDKHFPALPPTEKVVISLCIPDGTTKKDIRTSMSLLREQGMKAIEDENQIRVGHEEIETSRTEDMDDVSGKQCYLALGHHTEKRMSWGVREGVVGS